MTALQRLLPLMIITAFALLLGACDNHDAEKMKPKRAAPMVVVLKAHTIILSDHIEALGTAQSSESITITARVAGILEDISFNDGQKVHKGDVIARMDQDEQQAQLVAATAQLDEHRREIKRLKTLLARKAAAQRDLDERQTLALLSVSNLNQIKAQLDELTLRAPFDGKLGIRHVSPGALVLPGTTITTLDASDIIKLDFTIPSSQLAGLKAGQAIQASTDALADHHFNGSIAVIDSRIDALTRSILIRAEIDNSDGRLIPGMLMRVILSKNERQALAVPEESITQKQDKHFLTLIDAGNRAELRQVQTGQRQNGLVEITQGLKADEQVVVRGMGFIKAGKQVIISERWDSIPGNKLEQQ